MFENVPGWKASTAGARQWDQLPAAARGYVERLSELVGIEVGIVSTGPDREETVIRGQSALASWFS